MNSGVKSQLQLKEFIPKIDQPFLNKFPNISKNSRLNTPGYVGEEAYSNFYNKFKRLAKEKEVSPNGYSATTAYLTS